MSRKRVFDTVGSGEKMMHSEALGIVMIGHGEALGGANEFGAHMLPFFFMWYVPC